MSRRDLQMMMAWVVLALLFGVGLILVIQASAFPNPYVNQHRDPPTSGS